MPTSEIRFVPGLGWLIYICGRRINVTPFNTSGRAVQFVRDSLVR